MPKLPPNYSDEAVKEDILRSIDRSKVGDPRRPNYDSLERLCELYRTDPSRLKRLIEETIPEAIKEEVSYTAFMDLLNTLDRRTSATNKPSGPIEKT